MDGQSLPSIALSGKHFKKTKKLFQICPRSLNNWLGRHRSSVIQPFNFTFFLMKLDGINSIGIGSIPTPGTDPDIPDKVGCRSVAPSEGTGILHPASPSAMSDPMSPCPELRGKAAKSMYRRVSNRTNQIHGRLFK